jgi:hypothetical protein
LAGKANAKINSGKARQRADELQARLQRRMVELELERQISPLPPVAIGGSLVIPIGLLRKLLPSSSAKLCRRPGISGSSKEDGVACHADGDGGRETAWQRTEGRER